MHIDAPQVLQTLDPLITQRGMLASSMDLSEALPVNWPGNSRILLVLMGGGTGKWSGEAQGKKQEETQNAHQAPCLAPTPQIKSGMAPLPGSFTDRPPVPASEKLARPGRS